MKKLEEMTMAELGLRLIHIEAHKVHAFLYHKSRYDCINQRYHAIKRAYDRRLYSR